MSTRSAIIEKLPDGTYRGIYCHNCGYLDGVGRILFEHYQDPKRVSELIDLGDISFLGERISPIGKHDFDDREVGTTVAYHRDRNDSLNYTSTRLGKTYGEVESQIGHNNHVYLFVDGEWWHNNSRLRNEIADAEDLRKHNVIYHDTH